MRILWLAPWFRGLANLYGAELTRSGHEVLVVTTTGHPSADVALVEEIVGTPKLRAYANVKFMARVARSIRAFKPELAVCDETWDPRFLAMNRSSPRKVTVVHDAFPHDVEHERRGWRNRNQQRLRSNSTDFIVFSDSVRRGLSQYAGDVHLVPLTSDLSDREVSNSQGARCKQDFVLLGRMHPYKNIDHVIASFLEHARGLAYRGDKLVLWGKGSSRWANESPLVEVRDENYPQSAMLDGTMSAFKGNVCVYTKASQSGVHLVAMQLGVATIVSTAGGLSEYQPPAHPVVDCRDSGALTNWFDNLADAEVANALGSEARAWYAGQYGQNVAGRGLERVLAGLMS